MKFTAQLLEIGTYEQGESVTPCPKEPGCGARFCVGDRTFILPLTREQLGALDVGLYDCAEIEVRRPGVGDVVTAAAKFAQCWEGLGAENMYLRAPGIEAVAAWRGLMTALGLPLPEVPK